MERFNKFSHFTLAAIAMAAIFVGAIGSVSVARPVEIQDTLEHKVYPVQQREPIISRATVHLTCSDSLAYLIVITSNKYNVNLELIEEDYDQYTAGVFGGSDQKSTIIVRSPADRFTAVIGTFEWDGVNFYCLMSAYRPLTKEDTF